MRLGLFAVLSMAFLGLNGCRSMGKSAGSDGSSVASASEDGDAAARKITEYREVITTYPAHFGQQIRANDMDRARTYAETMYRTLEALETSQQLASQVCFGGTEWACRNFKEYIKPDITKLYSEFVMANSLSTGELLKIATKIETAASLASR